MYKVYILRKNSDGKFLSAIKNRVGWKHSGLMTFLQLYTAYFFSASSCVPCGEDATCIFNITPGAVIKHPVG